MSRLVLIATGLIATVTGAAFATTSLPPPTNVPEPASLAILAAGAGALAIARYRRRK